MRKLLREPLLHFFLLGGLVFLAYAWVSDFKGDSQDSIVVTLRQQENLANTFERTWQRPPTTEELAGLVVDFIRQEIAYRESQNMQLDRDDIVIRRRLRQKLEMLAEGLATLAPPTDEELQVFLDANPERFRLPAVLTIQHVYFNTDDDAESAEQRAIALLQRLKDAPSTVDLDAVGDPSMLPPYLNDVREPELASLFGGNFATDLSEIEVGTWEGPVRSGYGLHLVRVDNRTPGYLPKLDEVSESVQRDFLWDRRKEAIDALYDRLADNYTISVEASPDILPDGGESP